MQIRSIPVAIPAVVCISHLIARRHLTELRLLTSVTLEEDAVMNHFLRERDERARIGGTFTLKCFISSGTVVLLAFLQMFIFVAEGFVSRAAYVVHERRG